MNTKKYLVLGAGRSGIAATKILLFHNARVELYDDQGEDKLVYYRNAKLVPQPELKLSLAKNLGKLDCDAVILSPGFSPEHVLVKKALEQKIPILSEIDCAYDFLSGVKLIGITGTNGKSTTTVMLEKILQEAGLAAYAGGNLGVPLCELAMRFMHEKLDYLVVELSSFQLDGIKKAKLDLAILLNITPDHLDRYENMAAYEQSKLRILDLLKAQGRAVVNGALRHLVGLRNVSFSWLGENHDLLTGLRILGTHNQENANAAALAAHSLNISHEAILRGLSTYEALPHRCELVAVKDGVSYINDSKGTTVVAVTKALSMASGPTHLLLGGIAKGEDFSCLKPQFFPHVAGYYVYGQARTQILQMLATNNAYPYDNLTQAFTAARLRSKPGDIILLSPACASYDQFTDFTERGRMFKALVENS